MPGPTIGLVRPHLGKREMRGSAFLRRRRVYNGRSPQGMAEREPMCLLVHIRDSSLLCWRKIAKAHDGSCSGLQNTHIATAIESHEQ